ncbi:hypothetical protein APHACPA_1543 [Rickettsia amblyommatis str. Ac/Pa]|uniref:Uncharacterized protein n=1 Tax=Rickettsia amblyommatis str. Ac/Pa TaxID=1359164 RepID=A0A0F3N6H1_RICAM|nr:hypothetical protein APHACPA_1543 [Rickettsia amblyommatis str. Ac/Pa]
MINKAGEIIVNKTKTEIRTRLVTNLAEHQHKMIRYSIR